MLVLRLIVVTNYLSLLTYAELGRPVLWWRLDLTILVTARTGILLALSFCASLIFTRPDLYGESITVMRSVTNSSSTYKLKDHRGKVVVDKKVKEELDRVLMSFNIQVRGC